MSTSKIFKGTLILNWKSGDMRVVKKARSIGPSEIPVNFSVKVIIPQRPEARFEGEITLDDNKVQEMVFDQL
jgi:hypothetical protein